MPIDVSTLQVSLEEGERWRRTLSITIPSDVVQSERRVTMKRLATRLKLPGFRAGKVPPGVLEKRFGPAVDQELLDRVINEAYRGVLQNRDLSPISEGKVGEVNYKPEADLSFQISFDIAPELELARLGGFRVERPRVSVSDEDIDRVIDRIREQQGNWLSLDDGTPEGGDRVEVRIRQMEEAGAEPRPYEFVLGDGEAIPQIEEAIRTLSVGGSGEFTITVPPEAGSEEPPPPPRLLEISLDSMKRLELPDPDDALAKAAGDFDTLADLRQRVLEDLEKEAEREVEGRVRGSLLEQVIAANPFDVPETMIDQYIRAALGNRDDIPEDRFREAKEQLRPHAHQTVKQHLVVTRLAEVKELRATDEEIDARIEEIAARNDRNPGEVYARLQKSGQLEELEREITETKVFDLLKQDSTITDAG